MRKINKRFALYVILGTICALSFILRIPSFTFPLDYDVGGHLFYGMQVATRGFYSTLQEIRPVGILVIFALIYKIFGSSTVWVNIIGASFWVLSTYLLYKIADVLFDSKKTALFASLIFTFLASSRALQGEMANMETFFIPFSLLGFYLFFLAKKKEKKIYLVFSGFSFGVAFLTKHLAAFDFLVVFLFSLFLAIKLKRKVKLFVGESSVLISGFLTSILLVSLYFLFIGQLGDFFYFQFIKIHSSVSVHRFLGNALVNLKNNFLPIFSKTYFFWVLSLLGVIYTFVSKKEIKRFFVLFWIATVFAGIYYLWWFFPHHFLQLAPPVSVFAGLFLSDIYRPGEKWFTIKNGGVIIGVLLILMLFLKADSTYFSSFTQRVRGQVDRKEHLDAVGFDIGPDGWLSFYETADYLKRETKPEETVFIWVSVPTIYVLAEKQPISWYVYKYPLLPDGLRPMGFRGWFPNVKESRRRVMRDLWQKTPEYILVRVEPEKIFDELFSFSEFSNFIVGNYVFDRQFGNILIYKRARDRVQLGEGKVAPLETVKRFAAITEIATRGEGTEITFEPMVNPGGVLRRGKVAYPYPVKIDFEPISVEFLGWDGSDFVVPAGSPDLHLKIVGPPKPPSFIRVKKEGDGGTWNSRPYGVNRPLYYTQSGSNVDIFLDSPPTGEREKFDLYFIFEDGTISRQDVMGR